MALTITGAAFAEHPHILVPAHWHSMAERFTVHLERPFGTLYVNPADDPQRKKSNRRTPVAKTAQEAEPCNAHP